MQIILTYAERSLINIDLHAFIDKICKIVLNNLTAERSKMPRHCKHVRVII